MPARQSHTHVVRPVILVLNQMAGPLTWQLVEELTVAVGPVALLTGHPDTLQKAKVGYLLHSGNPNLLRSGLAADTRGHRRAVVFGDQATALHPKTA